MPEPRSVVSPFQPRRIGLPDQRVGDLERSAVCDELSAQYAAGRLVPDELEDRLTQAVEARTRSDLGQLLADLPSLEPMAPVAPVAARPAPSPVVESWSALDVLALLGLIGCLGLACVGALIAMSVDDGYLVPGAILTTLVAAGGGAAATHLVHRSQARHDAQVRTAALAARGPGSFR